MGRPAKLVIQNHHILYACPEHGQKEVMGNVYKGEHFILRHLNRRTHISSFFCKSIKTWLALNEDKAVDL